MQSLDPDLAAAAAKRVASGDLAGVIGTVPEALQVQIHAAAATAFANGFGAASLVAAIVAAITGALAFGLVRVADTARAKNENAEAGGLIDPSDAALERSALNERSRGGTP